MRISDWSSDVCSSDLDFRMPPDHPYPAALDDCIAAYRALLEDHAAWEIIVRGSSAGGNLAAALMLRARDEGLPFPARSEEHTSELQSLMRISYAVFCLKKKKNNNPT